ncbi:MAG: hypothetical protein QOH39_2454 [Verrucomicrobiota bacterium]|jgi:uncharacterized membrane protein
MEGLVLVALIVIVVCFVLPIVAMAKASGAQRALEAFGKRLSDLEKRLKASQGPVAESPVKQPEPEAVFARAPLPRAPAPPVAVKEETATPPAQILPLPVKTPPVPAPTSGPTAPASRPPTASLPPVNWEQFMGAKLFAWIGGLALFLGVGFFVKYSFEHNLIPPEVRVAIGFFIGLVLVVGGVAVKRKENAVTSQTLCATGILILYAVTFACRSFYHFAFFQLVPTFALMTLITATAFLLAVRMDAIVVAILGIAGGFLTPILLSTGQDNPLGLFGYIAVLDIGLLLVARRKDWIALPVLGAAGTIIMQVAWVTHFFVHGRYFSGNNLFVPMAIFLGFESLFLAAFVWVKRDSKAKDAFTAAAVGLAAVAVLWAFYFLAFRTIADRPAVLLGYILVADLGLLAIVFLRERLQALSGMAGLTVFTFLAIWTGCYLIPRNLYVALGAYFVFALLHASMPLLLQRARKTAVPWWCHGFPALALLLVLMPIFNLTEVSLLIWPLVLCVDILAILLAVTTGMLMPVLLVLFLTFIVVGGWMFRIPSALTGLPTSLFLLGGFAIFFLVASVWATRHLASAVAGQAGRKDSWFGDPQKLSVQLPALSATLPFLLLIMVTLRLPLTNPSPVFGLALLLIVLLLGMAKLISLDVLPAVGLGSVLALEVAWHFHHFAAGQFTGALLWYLGFTAVFTVFPFLFHRQFASKSAAWATSALAAPLHFFLIYDLVRKAHPNGMLGLLPAIFAVPSLIALFVVTKRTPSDSASKNAQLALFGGAALFFITLIFPIQFDREWITVGWALEGAALCWFFRRVPHPGLRLAGVGLLIVAFARLALNPAVLTYHARATTPIFNWYLYAYGITIISLFVAARLLAPPRNFVLGRSAQPILWAMGTILAFLLLNIEIADFFSNPGKAQLIFELTGNFARDLSYSIAWSIFALLLLIVGIRQGIAPVRYASIALLGVTILKLFLHDLSELEQLYRIAAFIVVAIIAIIASYLYQRFFGAAVKETS